MSTLATPRGRVCTTVNLPDDLVRRAKAEAAREGLTFTALLDDALRRRLARSAADVRFEITPFAGDGFHDGVDLTDNAALAAALDE